MQYNCQGCDTIEMQHIHFTLCGDSGNATAWTAHEEKLPRDWNDDGLTCIIAIGCAIQGAEHESRFIHIVGTSDI